MSAAGKEVSEQWPRTPVTDAVKGRSESRVGNTWFKGDTSTGRILNGSQHEHKGVRNEK